MGVAALSLFLTVSLGGVMPLAAQDPVSESEPNDTPEQADTAVLGGRVRGTYDPHEDVDHWVLHATAGDTIYVDVDAQEIDPISTGHFSVSLYASDGVTHLATGKPWDVLDPYLVYVAPATGWYYLRVSSSLYTGRGASAYYILNLKPTQCPVVAAEHEPNDTRATAHPLALNSSVSSLSCPNGEVDYYRVDIATPTTLAVELRTPPQRSPSYGEAFELSAGFQVRSADGTVVGGGSMAMGRTAPDSMRREIDVTPGTYYVSVFVSDGGYRMTYTLEVKTSVGTGPGDPIRTVAEISGRPGKIAVDRSGNLYVVMRQLPYGIAKVSPTGQRENFVTGLFVNDLAFDGFGNLLGAGTVDGSCCIAGKGVVYRIAPDGRYAPLINDLTYPLAIGVAPDGGIWVSDIDPAALRHYDGAGHLIASHDVSCCDVNDIAFSPAGVLHFSNGAHIYRFTGGQAQPIITQPGAISAFTFDANSGIFSASLGSMRDDGFGGSPRIDRYNASGNPVSLPFVGQINQPEALAFGRNADGSSNNRLFLIEGETLAEVKPGSMNATGGEPLVAASCPPGTESEPNNAASTARAISRGDSLAGAICLVGDADFFTLSSGTAAVVTLSGEVAAEMTLELLADDGATRLAIDSGSPSHNPQVRAPAGAKEYVVARGTFGSARPYTLTAERSIPVDVARALRGILHPDSLSADERTELDALGNSNGRYDIGDLRMLLIRAGVLASSSRRVLP